MSIESPPTTTRSTTRSSTTGQRAIIGGAIVVFAILATYLALVIITRVDSIFLPPGHQITLGPVGNVLPGIDNSGSSGSQQRLNILVMGLDRRAREGNIPTRTDTLFVMTVDPKTKTTGILGIPRDLWVNIPAKGGGTYQDRINTAYVAGENENYPGGGVTLLEKVLAAPPFGIKIDKYVIIDLKGFESVINDLGGIDVNVQKEVYDPYYSETELPGDYFPVHFYPGLQHMDGKHALAYARVRFNSDDLDRIQRQQRVIFAAIAKAKSLNVLKNATSLWQEYKDTVQTNIADYEIPKFALLAKDMENNPINAVSLGPATAPWTTPGGAEVLVGDDARIHEIVNSMFSDNAPPAGAQATATASPVRVQVQNGTGTDGLANGIVRYIIGRGYPASELTATNTTDGRLHNSSEIIDMTGSHRNDAYILADWLKIPTSHVRDATAADKAAMGSDPADIVVVLGKDVDFTQFTTSAATGTPGG